jgi:hypothetical protein
MRIVTPPADQPLNEPLLSCRQFKAIERRDLLRESGRDGFSDKTAFKAAQLSGIIRESQRYESGQNGYDYVSLSEEPWTIAS